MTALTGFDLCRAALAVEGVTAPEQSVLTTLAIMANADAQCWPGIAGLVARTKLSERTVQRAVQGLKDAGHLNWVDKPGRGRIYIVHPRHSDTPAEATPVTLTPRQPDTRQSDTPVTVTPTPVTVTPKLPRTTITNSREARARSSELGFHRMPDDWQPDHLPDITEAKVSKWPPGKLDDELLAFKGWAENAENKDGKGRKRNWQMAWINWLNRADNDWKPRNGTAQRNGASQSGHGRSVDAGFGFIEDGGHHRSAAR